MDPHQALVNGKIPYGTEYWFTSMTTRKDIETDFHRMRLMGMNTVRIFVLNIETGPEKEDYSLLDEIFSVAIEHNISVCPTFSLTLPPWKKHAIGLDPSLDIPIAYLLDDPLYRDQLAPGIQNLVRRYGRHPSLWSWILWNEPSRTPFFPPPPPTWTAFTRWLRERYETRVEHMLDTWGVKQSSFNLSSFDDLLPDHIFSGWRGLWSGYETGHGYHLLVPPAVFHLFGRVRPSTWDEFPLWRDWFQFNISALNASIAWLAGIVKELDLLHPTHINPDGFLQNQTSSGRDLQELAKSVDIFGSSLHLGHHFSYIDLESQVPEAVAFYTQQIASSAGEKTALVTELQAGPNTWSGNRPITPDSTDLILWSLTALGNGLKGIIYWLWKPREQGWEGGEWGLINANGKETTRSLGAGRLGQILETHGSWLASLKPRKSSVAILKSPDSETLGLIESLYTNRPIDRYQTLSEYGCYRALWHAGIHADIITPSDIQKAHLSDYRCIFLPFHESMSAETAQALKQYILSGGWVYAETPLATKDPAGTTHVTRPGHGLDGFFAQAIDIWPASKEPLIMAAAKELHSELFIQPLESGNHEVVAELSDGYDVIVERTAGKGRTLYAGTCLSLYCANNNPAAVEEAFISGFAIRAGARSWSANGNAYGGDACLLEGDGEDDAYIVMNHGSRESEVALSLPRSYREVVALLGRGEPRLIRRTVRMMLPPRTAEILKLRRQS